MPVNAPADKRFRRAHVAPSRRRRLRDRVWRRLARSAVILAGLGYAGYVATGLIFDATVLGIDRVVVRGNARLSTGAVLALVSDLRGENILAVDLDARRRRLVTSPWVAEASLRRVLPSTVEIVIAERNPMGLARLDDRLYLVDDSGVVIDEYGPQYASFDLPIVDGLAAEPRDSGAMVDETRARRAGRLIEALGARKDLARRVSQIDVRDAYDAVVILDGDPALIHLGAEQFVERLQSYLDLAPALKARVPQIDYVDLRFDQRVYVRPASRTAPRVAARTTRPPGAPRPD